MSEQDAAASLTGEEDALAFFRAGRAEANFVSKLTSAINVSRLHALENVVAQEALEAATQALTTFLERREQAEVLLAERRVYVNGRLVLVHQKGGRSWLDDFTDFMLRFGLGGIVLSGPWTRDALREFLNVFRGLGTEGNPESRARKAALQAETLAGPGKALLLRPEEAAAWVQEEEEGYASDTERAAYLYARVVALAESSHIALAEGRSPDTHGRFLRATLMKLVDRLSEPLFEIRLLALTASDPLPEAPLVSHVANVCVLSLAMGRLLGLSRGLLVDLGFAALHHDLGRVGQTPQGADGREHPLSSEEHVLRGMAHALRGRSYGNVGLLRLVVSQEHHRESDDFPEALALRDPHLFSLVVGVADAFDRLQNGLPWRPAVGPAAALRALEAAPEHYRPEVVALLRDVLGRYPRGTVLRLWDGSVGVVVSGGARRLHRPIVRRVLNPDQTADETGALLELEDPDGLAQEIDVSDVPFDWRVGVLV